MLCRIFGYIPTLCLPGWRYHLPCCPVTDFRPLARRVTGNIPEEEPEGTDDVPDTMEDIPGAEENNEENAENDGVNAEEAGTTSDNSE